MYSGAARKGAVAAALLGAATMFALRRRRKRTSRKVRSYKPLAKATS
jgi:hypothetical protein